MAKNVKSMEVVDPATGQKYLMVATASLDASGNVVTDSSGNPATNVVFSPVESGTRIQPKYGANNAGLIGLDVGYDGQYLMGALVSVDPGSDTAAQNDLEVYGDSVYYVETNKQLILSVPALDSSGAANQITDLYIVVIGSSTTTTAARIIPGSQYIQYGTGAATAGAEAFIRARYDTPANMPTAAQMGAQMVHLTFESTDRITDVIIDLDVPKWTMGYINPASTVLAAGIEMGYIDATLANGGTLKVHGYSRA